MSAINEFYISRANPLHFRYETGAGTYFAGQSLDGNFLAEDISDTKQVECSQTQPDYSQIFECSDATLVQFYLDGTDTPYAVLKDGGGTIIDTWDYTDMNRPGSFWHIEIDWSQYVCPGCYQLELYSGSLDNLYTDSDNGTFETNTADWASGGIANPNVYSRSNAQAHTGTWSGRMVFPVGADVSNSLIYYGDTPLVLTQGSVYRASCWVYNDAGSPGVTGQDIYIDPTNEGTLYTNPIAAAGWTDSTILNQTNYNYGTDGTGVWVYVEATFQVGAITSGQFMLISQKTPEGNGIIYVDDVQIEELSEIKQATFENVQLIEDYRCTVGVTYGAESGSEHPQFGLNYLQSDPAYQETFFIRIPMTWAQFRMEDPDYNAVDNSAGTSGVIFSQLSKIYTVKTGRIPWWLIEKLPMVMKHDMVKFEGVDLICVSDSIAPTWDDDKSLLASAEFDMRVKVYDYQNNNCGAE